MAAKQHKHEQTEVADGIDEELSALLDSTLNEFDATQPNDNSSANAFPHLPSTSQSSRDSSHNLIATQTMSTSTDGNTHTSDDNFDRNVTADFAKFDEMFAPLLNSDPELRDHWSKLTQSCNDAANSTSDEEFQKSLQETLKTIADKAKNVVGDESSLSEEELAKIWSNLGVNEESEANGSTFANLMPIMTNMMQNLLSKELLYPALSELCDKYPSWLSDNKDKLSAEELKQYTIQLDLMRQVCEEFDNEKPDDSETVKKERFQRILSYMQRMQACGSPPTELIGDVPDFGAAGLPPNIKFPEFGGLNDGQSQGQCVVM